MDLKPCPFCGGKANIIVLTSMPPKYQVMHTCPVVTAKPTDTAEEAIEAWNTRAERTCHDLGGVDEFGEEVFNCSKCGCVVSLYSTEGMSNICTSKVVDTVYFCPACGAKVVEG